MGNPFEGLRAALEVIAQEAKVLPATGQAVEDLMRPDHEEVIDRLRSVEDKVMDVLLETPNRRPYVELTALHRTEKHLLRFFLDGSARGIAARRSMWPRSGPRPSSERTMAR